MPTYVILYQFTEKGRRSIKSTVSRAAAARRENERRGFKVIGTWWTQGEYDLITVVDAPSESAMMGALFNVAEAGNVSSVSMRAFTETEMRRAFSASAGTATRKTAAKKRTTAKKRTATKRSARKAPAKRTSSAARKSASSRSKSARQSAASRSRAARKRPARKAARRR